MTRPPWLSDDLARVEDLLLESAGSSDNSLVGEAATHLLRAGGKRIRPALVLACARFGRDHDLAIDQAAAAIELVHLATLYHDDVIDATDTRRGVATVHSKWGTEIAVLAGDYLFARACELGALAGGDVPIILSRALAEVCEGQIMEMEAAGDAGRSRDRYVATISRKTGALFRAACDLGAATSGASEGTRLALVRFGSNLGLAFQVVDDLLDLIGDPEKIGKAPGTDLKEGILTLPVLVALERDPSLAELLAEDAPLESVVTVLERTGAVEEAKDAAAGYRRAALAGISELPAGDAVSALRMLVDEASAGLLEPLEEAV